MKVCRNSACRHGGEPQPDSAFDKGPQNRDGLQSYCKDCERERVRAARRADPEKARRQRRVSSLKSYYKHHEEMRAKQRGARLKSRYGISQEEYDQLLEVQGGLCAICGSPPRGRHRLHVDHDHETKQVRGLLCMFCNVRLAVLENPSWQRLGEAYLARYRKNEVA